MLFRSMVGILRQNYRFFSYCNNALLLASSPQYLSNWQLKGGHFSQKRKICALLAISISYHRRDLFIIQCTEKPYLVYPVGPRRKITENLSVEYHYFLIGAHLAQPVQLGCTADFEQLGPNSKEYSASWYQDSPSILPQYRATVVRPFELD